MKNERGQVLILSVIIMIILLMMVLFIFDMQLAIRAKMKVETAEQAAALTAAEWQRNSLNLIGELNLVKAGEVMLEGYSPSFGLDSDGVKNEKMWHIANSCRAITEMQSRIAFIGPLIAFGAAQQAAKYNGMNIYDTYKSTDSVSYESSNDGTLLGDRFSYNTEFGQDSDKKYIYDDLRNYRFKLDNYYRSVPEICNYYLWREPYLNMIANIRDRGLAVRGSGINMMNNITPAWLARESTYRTVLALDKYGTDSIRAKELKTQLQRPDSYWEGDWWKVSYTLAGFPEQSEIYPLFVYFSSNDPDNIETVAQVYEHFVPSGRPMLESELLSAVTWCILGNEWNFNLNEYNSVWYDGSYLRDEVIKSAKYEGPVAMAQTYERIKTISQHKVDVRDDDIGSTGTKGAAVKAFKRTTAREGLVKKTGEMTFRVGTDSRYDLYGGVAAKVMGQLNEDTPPNSASSLVLPFFHGVSMVPSTMFENSSLFRSEYTNLERFLKWLSELNTLFPPTIKTYDSDNNEHIVATTCPQGTEVYLEVPSIMMKRDFRRSMWNPDYVLYSVSFADAFKNNYKYPPWSGGSSHLENGPYDTDKGAGWLQQAYVGPRPYEAAQEAEYNQHPQSEDGAIRSDNSTNSTEPFLLTYKNRPAPKYVTNEEYYSWTYTPHTEGDYYRGSNVGPPRL